MGKIRRIVFFVFAMISPAAWASQEVLMNDYPYQPVSFTKVQLSDSFWLPRIETNRTVTIPFAFKQCEQTGRIENFKVAGKLSDKLWEGNAGYNDSDVFKVMEGAAYALMIRPDAELDRYLDEVISYVAAAQEPDGYLYTAWTAQAKKYREKIGACYINEPWDNLKSSHELYNVGHMYEAAAAHFLATGKRSFLDVAIKNADLICKTFGPAGHPGVPGHQEIEIGLAKLYRVTGDAKYLKQAKWFLDQRGRSPEDQDPYRQMHKPVVEQSEAVGHAVRANYMYSGMADVAAMTGSEAFIEAIDTIWEDVAQRKFYVTGGVGARKKGEAYGDGYELPNATAYCETCAAIANVYWNHRMFLLHGQSRYIDVMERSLYNAVLSGVALDGMHFFYPNPLESAEGHEREEWFGCACCPSNVCRFMASLPGYTYAVREDVVYVNLFVSSSAAFDVDGKEVRLSQKTAYPWDGKVRITAEPEDKKHAFTMKIRVPDWTGDKATASALYTFAKPAVESVTIAVNGKKTKIKMADGYAVIKRTWKKGDVVEVNFPMPVRRVLCDQRVADNVSKTALMRGPLVYCVEGVDVEGGKALNMLLATDAALTTEYKADLLGGLTVIKGTAIEGTLNSEGPTNELSFQAIPYYAWAHRGKTPMAVWLPYAVSIPSESR